MARTKKKYAKQEASIEDSEILESHVGIDDMESFVGKPYSVKDNKSLRELYLYIDYLKRSNDFLTILAKNKERRIRNLRKGLQRFSEISEDYIPIKITEAQIDNICNLSIPKSKDAKKKKYLELAHYYIASETYFNNCSSYKYKLSPIEFKAMTCAYLLESFTPRIMENAVYPLRRDGVLKVRELLKRLSDIELLYKITESKHNGVFIYGITTTGKEFLESFLSGIYEGQLEPFKLYEKYKKRKKEGINTDIWVDFGFPVKPIGKAETPLERRNRIRNRDKIKQND